MDKMEGWMDGWMEGWLNGQMERQNHHVEDSEDECGDVLSSMVLQHLLIHDHQRLHVESGISGGRRRSSSPHRWFILVWRNVNIFSWWLRHV